MCAKNQASRERYIRVNKMTRRGKKFAVVFGRVIFPKTSGGQPGLSLPADPAVFICSVRRGPAWFAAIGIFYGKLGASFWINTRLGIGHLKE